MDETRDTSPGSLRHQLAMKAYSSPRADPIDFAEVAARLVGADVDAIAEMLRLIWNARGEADIMTLVPILPDGQLTIAVPALQSHDRYKRL